MQTTPFDFDVITGPSTPRDDRRQPPEPAETEQPQSGTPAAPLEPR
jgi:hypothetical protein